MVGIDVYTNTHCNLKCRGCSRFSNISKPNFYNFDQYARDIEHLKNCDVRLSYLCFTGGEPLLNPKLIDFVRTGRKYYPDIIMSILTNGLSFDKQPIQLYKTLSETNTCVSYTKYPSVSYDKLIDICDKYNINHYNISTATQRYKLPETKNQFAICPLTEEPSDFDIHTKKAKCDMDCTCMFNGKIYQCGTACNISVLNDRYGIDLASDKNYIEVSSITSRFDIYRFLYEPIPLCRHCFNVCHENIDWCTIREIDRDIVADTVRNDTIRSKGS